MLSTLNTVYTKKWSQTEMLNLADTWEMLFQEVPDEIGIVAFSRCLKTCHINITPADMFDAIKTLEESASGDNLQKYWKIAWGAICGQKSKAAWDALPPEIREWFGSMDSVISMGESEETIESVVRGQFYKTFPPILEQSRTREKMPEGLRMALNDRLHVSEENTLTERQKNLLELARAIAKDAEELPEPTEAEKAERRTRYEIAL